jgi:hypothetical protein
LVNEIKARRPPTVSPESRALAREVVTATKKLPAGESDIEDWARSIADSVAEFND